PAPKTSAFLALEQRAGRGRHHRPWFSTPLDGIYVTYLFERPETASLAGFSLALGYAVYQTLTELGVEAALKWPNDVLTAKRPFAKLAGVLLESSSREGAITWVSGGIGLNLAQEQFPDGVPGSSVLLETGVTPNYATSFALLSRRVMEASQIFFTRGFNPFRELWWAASMMEQANVRVEQAEGRARQAVGLTEQGGLVVRSEDGAEQVVYSGEVILEQKDLS
ncbi:MAG: biotin--[acetyl-CoA-carboxylase] ligase, partial [Bdellovibrionales bacterium]|nr:biotin--[acetyl-CoA-carboxylase] ligase [Bdellovibrionales bacterium]